MLNPQCHKKIRRASLRLGTPLCGNPRSGQACVLRRVAASKAKPLGMAIAKLRLTLPHVICCLLVFFADIGFSSEQQGPNFSPSNSKQRDVGRQLQQSSISAMKNREDERKKTELQRLIEQVHSIRFEPKNQAPQRPIAVQAAPLDKFEIPPKAAAGSLTQASQQPTQEQTQEKLSGQSPYKPVSSQTLRMLENLSQHPEQVRDPFELAEILFVSGHLKQAATFYRLALSHKDPNDVASVEARAWILFQIGNCLRGTPWPPQATLGAGTNPDHDLPAARVIYRQLIEEHPNSFWADLAKTQEKLIDWYLKDKPTALIAECKMSKLAN